MDRQSVIIAGSGQGGFQVAASLRQDGFGGDITIIGEETGLPYQRPPLSKGYLKDGNAEKLLLRSGDFFEKNGVRLLAGQRLSAIDRHARVVTLEDGISLDYDHLVLALGARNRRLPIAGVDLDGVLELRTLEDAEHIRTRFAGASSLIVIGGGFIGLEVAATARFAGIDVTVLEATSRLMSRVVSAPVSSYFLRAHQVAGVDIRLESFASRITDDGNGRVSGVELADGTKVSGDLVLVCAGVVPNVEIAEASGLYVHDGIRVDDQLSTEDPHVSAIGDCASFPFGDEGTHIRLESVQNAVDQAKCVSKRITGTPERFAKVPWFWSDQREDKLQMAGIAGGADHHEVLQRDGKLTVLCFRRDELVGVETINSPAEHMAARKLLGRSAPVLFGEMAAGGFDIGALARAS